MIYFVRSRETGLIKIGTSICFNRRLYDIRDNGGLPEVLGVTKGGVARERCLHRLFQAYHHHIEWFYPSEHILAFIRLKTKRWEGEDDLPQNQPTQSHVSITHAARLLGRSIEWVKIACDKLDIELVSRGPNKRVMTLADFARLEAIGPRRNSKAALSA